MLCRIISRLLQRPFLNKYYVPHLLSHKEITITYSCKMFFCFFRHGLESNVLRFVARMDTARPIDMERRFIVSYFLSDDTILVFEPPQRNSGIIGGKFIERRKIKKSDDVNYYTSQVNVKSDDLNQWLVANENKWNMSYFVSLCFSLVEFSLLQTNGFRNCLLCLQGFVCWKSRHIL